MSTIILDSTSAEALRKCCEPAELRDTAGKIVGYFNPISYHVYKIGEIPEFDEDELDRLEARRDCIPSEEVRRRLEKLR